MSVPPPWLVRAVTGANDLLARLRRRVVPRHFAAIELGTTSWVAQSVAAFCELGLPEALSNGARTAAELAAAGYGVETALFRLLRALAAYEVVRYAGGGRFELGHIGKALVGERSVAPMIVYANAAWHGAAYAGLAQAVRTGRSAFEISQGTTLFEYFAQEERAAAIFDAAMQALTLLYAPPFAAAYDFSRAAHVVDVGGGTGLLLAAVLQRFERVCGTIFELPGAAARARDVVQRAGLGDRLAVVEGDILAGSPPPADAYIFSHVLHDWDDDSCERMLRNVRRVMTPSARVLVFEIVAPPPNNAWSQDRITDLEMLAMLPGRERTREEFVALLGRAGLEVRRIIPTAAPESILEVLCHH